MQVTKSQVAEILDSRGQELVNNVEALLLAVKSTNDFEAEMARRFGGSISEDTEHEVGAPCTAAAAVFFASHSSALVVHSPVTAPGLCLAPMPIALVASSSWQGLRQQRSRVPKQGWCLGITVQAADRMPGGIVYLRSCCNKRQQCLQYFLHGRQFDVKPCCPLCSRGSSDILGILAGPLPATCHTRTYAVRLCKLRCRQGPEHSVVNSTVFFEMCIYYT